MAKQSSKPKQIKAKKLQDLKIRKDVKGGCWCQNMGADPASSRKMK